MQVTQESLGSKRVRLDYVRTQSCLEVLNWESQPIVPVVELVIRIKTETFDILAVVFKPSSA